jgi:RND family efflux transporter MFP subunit
MKAGIGMGLVLLIAACGSGGDEEAEVQHRVPVSIQEVKEDSIAEIVELVGRLTPPPGGEASMTAPTDGVVRSILVQVGQPVARGTLLLTVDAPDLAAAARSQRAQAVAAQQELERQRELLGAGVASQKQLEEATAAATAAQAAASAAEELQARTMIVSPIAGSVQQISVNTGERVSSGASLVQVVNGRTLTIVATVPAPVLARLRTGMVASIVAEGAADTVPGEVQGVSPGVDTVTNAGTVVIRIPSQPSSFRAGAGATARVVTTMRRNVLVVPDSALVVLGAITNVFVLQPDTTVKAIPVEVGARSPGRVQISGAVKPGDRVVTTGAYGLSDGMHVVPEGSTPAVRDSP